MPIYEYLCEDCGRITERMQKMSDPPLRTCPECGARKVAKLVSRTAFQLKGGGWYADLYSSPKKEAKGGDDGSPGGNGAGEGAKSASTGDAKPPVQEKAAPAAAAKKAASGSGTT